jgi:hypothetical protein
MCWNIRDKIVSMDYMFFYKHICDEKSHKNTTNFWFIILRNFWLFHFLSFMESNERLTCAAEKKTINSELWHACAGPLVSLPPVGSLVVYYPQGHSEQVDFFLMFTTKFLFWYIFVVMFSDS